MKKSGQSVIDQNLPYRFLRGQPLKCLAAKITPKNAHLITLSDEKSGTMLFKAGKGFSVMPQQAKPLHICGQ